MSSFVTRPLNRRAVLRGAGGALIALPWLEAMSPRKASAATAAPKRLLTWFTPNGVIHNEWVPQGTTTNFTFGKVLAPLEPVKNDVVIIDGVKNYTAGFGPGDGHTKGIGTMLTGIENLPGNTFSGAIAAGGISVDQEIVRRINPPTKLPSLQVGVNCATYLDIITISIYKGAGQFVPNESDPVKVFDRLFAGGIPTGQNNDAALQKIRDERKSMLDAVDKTYNGLYKKISARDKAALDSHLTELRNVEQRLALVAPTSPAACVLPTRPAPIVHPDGAGLSPAVDFPAIGKLQMDLLIAAMTCDLARINSMQWTTSTSNQQFPFLGINRGHHDISHDPTDNMASQNQLIQIDNWYAQQLAYFIQKLGAVQEYGGTLLDNTLIYCTNELARGNTHDYVLMPYILAGRAGGSLKTGRFIKSTGWTNNLLVWILNTFGVPDQTFGNPKYGTGPLKEI